MAALSVIVTIILPAIVSILWSKSSYQRIMQTELLAQSTTLVKLFVLSRAIYWAVFGILLTAFLFAFIVAGASGETTRSLLLVRPPAGGNQMLITLSSMLSYWRFLLVIVSLVSIFVALSLLFLIGRLALKRMPDDETPGPEFVRARASFFFLGMSLMLPALLLSLFLSL